MHEPETTSIWEARYRDLERTLEHVMIQVADAMDTTEAQLAAHRRRDEGHALPRIRKLYKDPKLDPPTVVCVADGENLAYRFRLEKAGTLVQEYPEQRVNSLQLPAGSSADAAVVHVVSHANGRTAQGSCRLEVGQ